MAQLLPSYLDFPFHTEAGFLKGDLHRILQIVSTLGPIASGLPAAKRVAAHKRVKDVLEPAEPAEIESTEPAGATVGERVMSELVILLAFFGIAQNAVCFASAP